MKFFKCKIPANRCPNYSNEEKEFNAITYDGCPYMLIIVSDTMGWPAKGREDSGELGKLLVSVKELFDSLKFQNMKFWMDASAKNMQLFKYEEYNV